MNYPNTKLILKSTDSNNNTISTTIGYCNPNADDALLTDFAQKLNDFTNNNFVSIQKVDTEDITLAEYPMYITIEGVEFNTQRQALKTIDAGAQKLSLKVTKTPDATLSVRYDGVEAPTDITLELDPNSNANEGYSTVTLKIATTAEYTGSQKTFVFTLMRNSEVATYKLNLAK